jgi:Ankyrin repeats (3 copies)
MMGTGFVKSICYPFGDRTKVPTLLHLAKRGKFDAMIDLLKGAEHQFYLDECADSANHHGTLNMFMGKSTLQLVMACLPPVALVDLLIQRCREHNPNHSPEDSIDMQGRTPLHVAVEHGCSFETCERLMGDNLPVIMKDQMDRTPLHYACIHTKQCAGAKLSSRCHQIKKRNRNHCAKKPELDNSYRIVCVLVSAYPEATMIADIYGKTPIILAKENHADSRIVALLASVRNRIEQPTFCDGGAMEKLLGSSMYTISSSSLSSDDDLSSVGSCGVSTIEI